MTNTDAIQQIKDKATHLSKFIDWKEFDNGTKRVIITAGINSQEWDELIAIIGKVDNNSSLGIDSRYEFAMQALGMIADSTAETEEELRDMVSEIEPDVYTSDLTEWLNQSNEHVYYLTEAIEEFNPKDGFAALSLAQVRAKEDAFSAVLEYFFDYFLGETK